MGNSGSKADREHRLAREWGYAQEADDTAHCCYFRIYHDADDPIGDTIEPALAGLQVVKAGTLTVKGRNPKRTLVSYISDGEITQQQVLILSDEIKQFVGSSAKVSWVLKNIKHEGEKGEHTVETAHEEEDEGEE